MLLLLLKIRGKKFKQNVPENCKNTKMAITVCIFSKILRGSMPSDTLKPFLFLNLLHINCVGKNSLRLKMSKN